MARPSCRGRGGGGDKNAQAHVKTLISRAVIRLTYLGSDYSDIVCILSLPPGHTRVHTYKHQESEIKSNGSLRFVLYFFKSQKHPTLWPKK